MMILEVWLLMINMLPIGGAVNDKGSISYENVDVGMTMVTLKRRRSRLEKMRKRKDDADDEEEEGWRMGKRGGGGERG